MQRSSDHILTTHVGSLIRPEKLLEFIGPLQAGKPYDETAYAACLTESVAEIVREQTEAGIDVVSDGEFGKSISWSQYALERLQALTKNKDTYFSTEVGQHQMWAAQFLKFDQPNHWLTSGGLGTMGYGLPAAIGAQVAHPDALVIDVAGEASILMNIQESSTAAQYRLPVKIFILNNQYMGMVRQWQELLHGGRYSESYMSSLPDFVKMAEAFGGTGLIANKPSEVDGVIKEMINTDGFVIADIRVDQTENCFPMIPSGAPHYEMLLGPKDKAEKPISEEGMVLV